ncbi:MAG: TonB-dependent receptor plug [Ignavibacteria bacterium]|nr:MAG: TonB-dependent receptor plug [Ignavibacteria bacterium]KAF0158876.1 MAG: TonB-dependent receptor plug [Ignavibacteria bacterium]
MKKILFLILFLFINSALLIAQAGKAKIIGEVIDEATKEPIPGVNVTIVGSAIGAATDIDGKFDVTNLEIGTYQVRVSAVGYNTIVKSDVVVSSAKPTELLFELSQTVIEFEGITVRSGFFSKDPTEIGSIASFSYEEIRRAPGGFEDVVRALSVLPGVAQTNAGRNDLIVRGGAPSENLYIVDGFVVPNINHFGTQGATGGPISFINLDFVRETSFSTGGFSSLYGDKLSSVLTIDLRDGRKDKIGGKGTISASQFGFNLEGPIGDAGNFLFSARRSYLDFIFNAAGFNFVPQYYDLLSKFTYNIDSKSRLSYLFIGAFDNVKFNNETSEDKYENSRILGSDQNTYVTGLSYRRLFDKGFFTLTLSRNFTDYDSAQRDSLLNPIFLNKSREGENELKADVVYKLTESSELNLGASAKMIKFNAGIVLPTFQTTFGETLSLSALTAKNNYVKLSSYLQYSDALFKRVRFSLGARADYFDGIESKSYFSPRMSFSYMISDAAAFNFSAGVYHQSPSYIWLAAIPTNKNLRAVRVNQFVLGYEQNLREDIRMKLEGFYKDYSDYPASLTRPYLLLVNTGAGFGGGDQNFDSFGFEPLVNEGVGDVRGIEFSMQKKSSNTPHYAILSVTYSESNFKGIDQIKRAGTYDQRWIVNLSGGYIFNNKWEAALKFRFATGSPYTPFNSNGTQSVVNYNTARFKEFHSLDLRFDRRWNFDKWALITYLDIQNIYNNKQSNTIRWDYRKGEVDQQSSIGILPSIGISLEF